MDTSEPITQAQTLLAAAHLCNRLRELLELIDALSSEYRRCEPKLKHKITTDRTLFTLLKKVCLFGESCKSSQSYQAAVLACQTTPSVTVSPSKLNVKLASHNEGYVRLPDMEEHVSKVLLYPGEEREKLYYWCYPIPQYFVSEDRMYKVSVDVPALDVFTRRVSSALCAWITKSQHSQIRVLREDLRRRGRRTLDEVVTCALAQSDVRVIDGVMHPSQTSYATGVHAPANIGVDLDTTPKRGSKRPND